MNVFLRLPSILSYHIPRTPEEVVYNVSADDSSFVQNLSEAKKMQLLSEVTFNMY